MARPLRIEWAGCWYHLTARGNERRAIFWDDEDRSEFLRKVAEMTARFRAQLHAFVLMDTHYHLLLQTLEANLSALMQWLNSQYCQGFNRQHRRTGHLLEGRFKAVVVEPERWGLELSRYIHLNPVRVARFELDKRSRTRNRKGTARGVDPAQWQERIQWLRGYRWSSYRAYMGLEPTPSWLQCEKVLSWMGGGEDQRRTAYQGYVEDAAREGLLETPWKDLQAQVVLGSEAFLEEVRTRAQGDSREQDSLRGLQVRPSLEEIIAAFESVGGKRWPGSVPQRGDWSRDLVLYLAQQHSGLSLKELGREAGGMDYGAVSEAIRRFRKRVSMDPSIADVVERTCGLLKI
jgi:REP-associated tyrosine transposase